MFLTMLLNGINDAVFPGHTYLVLPLLLAPYMIFDYRHFVYHKVAPKTVDAQRIFNSFIFQGGSLDCRTMYYMQIFGKYRYDDAYYKRIRNALRPEQELAEKAACKGCFKISPPEYLFEWAETCPLSNPEIFFMIKSAPGNFDRRQAVRQTWLRNPIIASEPHRFRYAFFSGLSRETHEDRSSKILIENIKRHCKIVDCALPLNHSIPGYASYRENFQRFLDFNKFNFHVKSLSPRAVFDLQLGEALTYADVIISDNFVDSYSNLTHKLLAGLQWTRKFCPQARFVVPMDDDAFVFVDRLLKLLQRYKRKPYFMGGNRMYGEPNREKGSKWYISPKIYDHEKAPDFYNGAIYVAGNDSVEALIKVMPNLRVNDLGCQLDDFLATGFARALAGIEDEHLCYFSIGSSKRRRFRHHEIEPWVVAILSTPDNTLHLNRAILAAGNDIANNPIKNLSLALPDN